MTRRDRSAALEAWIAGSVQGALAYAQSLVRSRADAEDLVQDCYRRLLEKANEYDLPREGTKLLFRAVTHACINWIERRRPEVSLEAGESGGSRLADRSQATPEQTAMGRELESAIAAALERLPVTQRAAIELVSLGYSIGEAADMLDITEGNARVVLHRARQSLAAHLKSFLGEART